MTLRPKVVTYYTLPYIVLRLPLLALQTLRLRLASFAFRTPLALQI